MKRTRSHPTPEPPRNPEWPTMTPLAEPQPALWEGWDLMDWAERAGAIDLAWADGQQYLRKHYDPKRTEDRKRERVETLRQHQQQGKRPRRARQT